jgi:hypothetical protein
MLQSSRVLVLLSLFVLTALAVLVMFRDRVLVSLLSSNTVPGFPLPYRTEEEWIVSQTARAVVDLAAFAHAGSPVSLEELSVSTFTASITPRRQITFQMGSRAVSIDLDTYVWDPDAYLTLARAAGVSAGRTAATDSDEIVAALVDLTADTLRAQSDVVSAALQADFRNSAHHEAAAFILTAFALRETSGVFYDPRLVLCRASAHLAVARAMRGAAGASTLAGELADIMLQIVGGRPGPAMRLLDTLERSDPPPAADAWSRALRRRITLDWRVPPSDAAPLVERLEYMRALARMVSSNASLEYLRKHEPEDVPDWGWRTLDLRFSVESGHLFVESTLAHTYAEAERMLGIRPSGNARTAVTAALTRQPGPSSVDHATPGVIHVIDDGMWSAFYQRHLAHVAMRGSEFYRDKYGSKGAAATFDTEVDRLLADVPLWLILQRLRVTTPAEYRAAMTRVLPLLYERPDTVAYMAWTAILSPVKGAERIEAPQLLTWFSTPFPAGTAFEPRRLSAYPYIPTDVVAQIDALHDLSPWDPLITINWSVIRCKSRCTPEQERANYSLIADYSLASMKKFALLSPDPVGGLGRLCEISVDECPVLSDWLLSRDRFAEAADVAEKFVRDGRDRVQVSTSVEWLVRYYQRAGRTGDARRIAELAAEVGSASGLRALAGFHDRRGDHDRAEELYRDIYRRYDSGTDLLAFHLRRAEATGRTPDGVEYVTLIQKYFDGQIGGTPLGSPAVRPPRGLRVQQTTWWNEKAGLRQGDIVVAVDGVPVWTTEQYGVLYQKSFDAPLRFTVWRPHAYTDIEAPFRRYYYGVDLQTYGVPERK